MVIEGSPFLSRIKYRKQVGVVKRKIIVEKGEIFKQEMASSEFIDEKLKNPMFGF